jgi:hypothetical protein
MSMEYMMSDAFTERRPCGGSFTRQYAFGGGHGSAKAFTETPVEACDQRK